MMDRNASLISRKRSRFHLAFAWLAITRNLAVALAISVMSTGAVGLLFWALSVKRDAPAKAMPLQSTAGLPVSTTSEPVLSSGALDETLFTDCQMWPGGPTVRMVDPRLHPELYVPVEFRYSCGHPGKFTPADSIFSASDPANYKAQLEQRLCPSCQAQADYRAAKQAKQRSARGGNADATR